MYFNVSAVGKGPRQAQLQHKPPEKGSRKKSCRKYVESSKFPTPSTQSRLARFPLSLDLGSYGIPKRGSGFSLAQITGKTGGLACRRDHIRRASWRRARPERVAAGVLLVSVRNGLCSETGLVSTCFSLESAGRGGRTAASKIEHTGISTRPGVWTMSSWVVEEMIWFHTMGLRTLALPLFLYVASALTCMLAGAVGKPGATC